MFDREPHYPARYRSRLCNADTTASKSRQVYRYVCSTVLLSLIASAPSISAQNANKWSRDRLVSAAREIMTTVRYCALITIDRAGNAQSRTMDALAPGEDNVVWLVTNPRSRKVSEIRRHPRVTLYYFDRENQAYVTIQGIARLVNDGAEKTRHWKDEWTPFYPNRNRDALLIGVRPIRLEVVNIKKGIVGDPQTWKPPTVTFQRPKR